MRKEMNTVNSTSNIVVKSQKKELHQELVKLGLSETQARIYLLLVMHKELRIQEIVKLARIPRSSVYENIKGLYELGIAEEVIDENFKRIRPYSIGAMRHGLDEQMLQLKRLINDLDSLEQTLNLELPENSQSFTTVRYYKNRSGARQLYWNTLKTKSIVYVYSDWGRGRYVGMQFYKRFVEESRNRQVKEKVLINPTPAALESIKKFTFPGSSISRTRIEDIRIISNDKVSIKGDTLIYDNVYANVFLKNIEINGFEIESLQFSEMQKSIFETLWENADPLIVNNPIKY
jgi:sugar-specific transcriptional regulator TrmB